MKTMQGTTIFIGKVNIETKISKFKTFLFQDVIDKKYIMALCYGEYKRSNAYIRIHSSCITSETILDCFCDCSDQLESALKKIREVNSGILFYLTQCGRAAGNVCKFRGTQSTQYHQEQITTFEAYAQLGLEPDYRDYRNIRDILILLDIQNNDFNLITNNPDKIEKLTKLNIKIKDIIYLETPPNLFNQYYLQSKKKSGHLLHNINSDEIITDTEGLHEGIPLFEPYNIENAERFMHCATNYLPIRTIDNRIIMTEVEFDALDPSEIIEYTKLKTGDYLVKQKTKKFKPYWFKAFVYYDICCSNEYIVLTYGDIENIVPIVRIHSEFLFNRFPLKDESYKNRYKRAIIDAIINNSGIIILENYNGDNQNLGSYILNSYSFDKTGIKIKREYLPSILLLKHHLKGSKNDLDIKIYCSSRSKKDLETALQKSNFGKIEWINVEKNNEDDFGHKLLKSRIDISLNYLNVINNITLLNQIIPQQSKIYVTGIGSSSAAAQYLSYCATKNNYICKYVLPIYFHENNLDSNAYLIVISQGLSPHGIIPLNYFPNDKIILITSVTENNSNETKRNILKKVKYVYNFPLEDEYETLIRVIGPMSCFYLINQLFYEKKDVSYISESKLINYEFIKKIIEIKRVILVVSFPITEFYNNIKFKFIEGAFIEFVDVTNELEIAHGIFQNTEYFRNKDIMTCYILINIKNKNIKQFLEKYYPVEEIITQKNNDLEIIELEYIFNHLIYNLITLQDIDQKSWPGKLTQSSIYEI